MDKTFVLEEYLRPHFIGTMNSSYYESVVTFTIDCHFYQSDHILSICLSISHVSHLNSLLSLSMDLILHTVTTIITAIIGLNFQMQS